MKYVVHVRAWNRTHVALTTALHSQVAKQFLRCTWFWLLLGLVMVCGSIFLVLGISFNYFLKSVDFGFKRVNHFYSVQNSNAL